MRVSPAGLLGPLSEERRMVLFGVTFASMAVGLACLVTASFPSTLNSSAGRIFTLPVTVVDPGERQS